MCVTAGNNNGRELVLPVRSTMGNSELFPQPRAQPPQSSRLQAPKSGAQIPNSSFKQAERTNLKSQPASGLWSSKFKRRPQPLFREDSELSLRTPKSQATQVPFTPVSPTVPEVHKRLPASYKRPQLVIGKDSELSLKTSKRQAIEIPFTPVSPTLPAPRKPSTFPAPYKQPQLVIGKDSELSLKTSKRQAIEIPFTPVSPTFPAARKPSTFPAPYKHPQLVIRRDSELSLKTSKRQAVEIPFTPVSPTLPAPYNGSPVAFSFPPTGKSGYIPYRPATALERTSNTSLTSTEQKQFSGFDGAHVDKHVKTTGVTFLPAMSRKQTLPAEQIRVMTAACPPKNYRRPVTSPQHVVGLQTSYFRPGAEVDSETDVKSPGSQRYIDDPEWLTSEADRNGKKGWLKRMKAKLSR